MQVRELRALGLTPDLLACRSAQPLEEATKDKLAAFCHVSVSARPVAATQIEKSGRSEG
jgi:CTP synthase (UTP-ammonia lyase)